MERIKRKEKKKKRKKGSRESFGVSLSNVKRGYSIFNDLKACDLDFEKTERVCDFANVLKTLRMNLSLRIPSLRRDLSPWTYRVDD